jgi:hypothetical protein
MASSNIAGSAFAKARQNDQIATSAHVTAASVKVGPAARRFD